jgi:hypothetical protein
MYQQRLGPRTRHIDSDALERAALSKLFKQRQAGRFVSAEEMDQRLAEILKAKMTRLASRKD